eukprot:3048912-Prymnesium_polylepis.1
MARVYRAHPGVGGGESVGELLYLPRTFHAPGGGGGESHTHQGRQEHEEHEEQPYTAAMIREDQPSA